MHTPTTCTSFEYACNAHWYVVYVTREYDCHICSFQARSADLSTSAVNLIWSCSWMKHIWSESRGEHTLTRHSNICVWGFLLTSNSNAKLVTLKFSSYVQLIEEIVIFSYFGISWQNVKSITKKILLNKVKSIEST